MRDETRFRLSLAIIDIALVVLYAIVAFGLVGAVVLSIIGAR